MQGRDLSLNNILFNRSVQGIFYQIVTLALVILAVIYIVDNTARNMVARGLASGFEFLGVEAQFDIQMTLIEYSPTSTYFDSFIVGLLNTLLVAGLGIFVATIVGFTIGIARLSSNWLIAKLAEAYIEVLRNLPLLLQIFFWYFAVLRALPKPKQSLELFDSFFLNNRGLFIPDPIFGEGGTLILYSFIAAIIISIGIAVWSRQRQNKTGQTFPVFYSSVGLIILFVFLSLFATGFPVTFDYPELKGFNFKGGIRLIPELVALTFALSMYTASFIAEVVRAGIQAVSLGQTEAARSLGLNQGQILRLVIIPQALRVIVPPLTNQYLNLTKNSSLAAAIAYPDLVLVFAGTALMQTGQAIEIIGMVMGVYLLLSLLTSIIMNLFNRFMRVAER
ncbi:MAG: amino acid ABC transporter permease [Pelagibacteraceae bacterium]|nr:amino acid ABC transporter permease [Pelagibacteraceae bacterium]